MLGKMLGVNRMRGKDFLDVLEEELEENGENEIVRAKIEGAEKLLKEAKNQAESEAVSFYIDGILQSIDWNKGAIKNLKDEVE